MPTPVDEAARQVTKLLSFQIVPDAQQPSSKNRRERRLPIVLQVVVGLCVILMSKSAVQAAANGARTTTVYVGRHFEMRNNDEPVKYVWNGDNRVARITGSLAPTSRIQQLRLFQGWNVVSVAVTASNAVEQLSRMPGGTPVIMSAYIWNRGSNAFESIASGQTVPAGSVLWLRATSHCIAKITGLYVEPTTTQVIPEGAWLCGAGLQEWSPDLPGSATVWKYDAATGSWQATHSSLLAPPAQPRAIIAPGEAVYVHTAAPIELHPVDPQLGIAYYHQDHLGSAGLVTDAAGGIIEKSAYYPSGATRQEEKLRRLETHYGFSQQEQDEESSLQYFGHRYQHPVLGRWISTDPLGEKGGGPNPYAYVDNNPLKLSDPNGAEITITPKIKGDTITYHIQLTAVVIDVSSKKFDQSQLTAFRDKLKTQIETSYKGSGRGTVEWPLDKPKLMNIKWETTAEIRVVSSWSEVKRSEHVFRIVNETKNHGSGDAYNGKMLINLGADIFARPTPDRFSKVPPADPRLPWEMHHQPEAVGGHEFGHTAGLSHADYKRNLMTDGQKQHYLNLKIEQSQIRTIIEAYSQNRLNKRDAELDKLTK